MPTPSAGGPLTPPQFIAKWRAARLSERSASQEHFIDLCRMLGQPTPAEHDATGAEYTFEKGVAVDGPASPGSQGRHGFADVWWRGKFAIEYKRRGRHATLDAAYQQLNRYREPLANPPLLIVTDIERFQLHTNFTGFVPTTIELTLEQFGDPRTLDVLRRVFTDPESFRPTESREAMTAEVAKRFGELADALRRRHPDEQPLDIAHFLMKCMFCLFAEDVDLLPAGLFKSLLEKSADSPEKLRPRLVNLFAAMAVGGDFGTEDIAHFNGGLFKDGPVYDLTSSEIGTLILAAAKDWSGVEPSIFGTLFERSLDPTKRAQIGAHYTSRDDIMLVIEPVILRPLKRAWETIRQDIDKQLDRRRKATTAPTKRKADQEIGDLLTGFMHRLGSVRVLDPACGSGNFLFVAIQCLLDLEKQVIQYAAQPEISVGLLPNVRPTQLRGIEINPFAAELAQVVIWIGYLQWMRDNGFNVPRDPILEDLQTIENRDAILDLADPDHPKRASWPDADFIVGNPPFLGGSLIWEAMGTDYRNALWSTYSIPNFSDLCCYWFERARHLLNVESQGHKPRVGLLATQAIRGGANRKVLELIKDSGDIFYAVPDNNWILDGAAVHVSIVGFDSGAETIREIAGKPASSINADLTSGLDTTTASTLQTNLDICFIGTKKAGKFELKHSQAERMLAEPANPNGQRNADVIKAWSQGRSVNNRWSGDWIIDFGTSRTLQESASYEVPFEYVREKVKPARDKNKRATYRDKWWLHAEVRPGLRKALRGRERVIATARHAKHRMYAWTPTDFIPDDGLFVFTRSDDYFFGVLHSSVHELWARRMGTQLREAESGFRYTPTTCFETFALPWSPGREPEGDALHAAIGGAAKELNELRENWLNPPEWIGPIAERIDREDDFSDVPEATRALIRRSAIMAAAAQDKNLKKRTLTNLYNQRPTWLRLAHEKLDRAVLAAYAATDPAGHWRADWAEVWTETGAGQPLPDGHELAERRAEVEQRVLANLLRLNHERAGG